MDSSGNVYVADQNCKNIRKITSAGIVTTFAGMAFQSGSTDGTGTSARFAGPRGIAVDGSGNLYVTDGNYTIRKITPSAEVTTLAGTAYSTGSADGTGSAARFGMLGHIAVDSSGNIYVADSGNHTIRKITPGAEVTTLAGTAGSTGSTDGTGSAARFNNPTGIGVDSSGNLYVVDTGNHTIRKITPAGEVTTLAGTAGSASHVDGTGSAARFQVPKALAVDLEGNIYVCDGTNVIRHVTPAGIVTTICGAYASPGIVDGTGAAARFRRALGIAVDSSLNVYITDENPVRKGALIPY